MYQPRHVANALIQRAELTGTPMTQMRLQKMLYFLHGCYSVWHQKPLLPEVFEVWAYGPAIDTILREYTEGLGCIPERAVEQNNAIVKPGAQDKEFWSSFDTVWVYFSKYTDIQLSNMANCEGTPWQKMMADKKQGHTIPQTLIVEYFKSITVSDKKVNTQETNVVHVDFGHR